MARNRQGRLLNVPVSMWHALGGWMLLTFVTAAGLVRTLQMCGDVPARAIVSFLAWGAWIGLPVYAGMFAVPTFLRVVG